MNWLPSHRVPPFPWDQIDWKMRLAFGHDELHKLWLDMWWSGVAAGRIEGVVGTVLVGLVLAVMVISVVVAVKVAR